MLTPNDATNAGNLHESGNSLFTAWYSRLVKFIPCSVITISTPTHDVTLLDELHKGFIAGFTLGWTTRHPSNETASAGIEQPTKPRYGIHFLQVTDDCVLHFWALVKIPIAFFRISLSSRKRRFSRRCFCIYASRAFPFLGNELSGCSVARSTHRWSVVEPIPRSRAPEVTSLRSTTKRTASAL